MENRDEYNIPSGQERIHQLLMKVVAYQYTLPGGGAVELDDK